MPILSLLSNFKHKGEIRESKDEIFIGNLVLNMAQEGWALIGVRSHMDAQQLRFRTVGHEVLHSVQFILDRKTGGGALTDRVLGSKATFNIIAEVKNLMADPDDLLDQWKTDFKNIAKIPLLGDIKVNHEMNSIFARKACIIDINNYVLKGEAGDEALNQLIDSTVAELIEKLAPYKKAEA